LELVRSCKGLMWANMFMAYVVQVKYIWMFLRNLQCCACVGRSSTYQYGSFKYRFFLLRIHLLCGVSNGVVPRRLGIFLVGTFPLWLQKSQCGLIVMTFCVG
jgi:hypothetical protein